ncbi:hypothetical protein ColTof4_09475 [Colletotrichum tofieldiae]|nr:hypothetical protein ColTof3_04821 [Colletotrichum tofieldiae]GKT77052.1 hypothetical protein ColTof4_09475 [Colletotrichum tofieldiae]
MAFFDRLPGVLEEVDSRRRAESDRIGKPEKQALNEGGVKPMSPRAVGPGSCETFPVEPLRGPRYPDVPPSLHSLLEDTFEIHRRAVHFSHRLSGIPRSGKQQPELQAKRQSPERGENRGSRALMLGDEGWLLGVACISGPPLRRQHRRRQLREPRSSIAAWQQQESGKGVGDHSFEKRNGKTKWDCKTAS